MNAKSIAMGVVAMVVATVLVVTCAVPIISDSVKTEDTLINDGYIRMTEITSDDEGTFVLSWDGTKPNVVTVNDVDVPISNISKIPTGGLTLAFNDNWAVRGYQTNGSISSVNYVRSVTSGGATTSNSIELTMSGGTMTIEVNGESGTGASYTHVMIPSNDGEYIMKLADKPAYVTEESRLVGFGLSNVELPGGTTSQIGLRFDGSIENGIEFTKWRGSTVTTTFETPVINTSDSGYVDVYKLNSIVVDVNAKSSSSEDPATETTTVTYSYFVVPYEIENAERTIHVDGPTGDILSVIPILMVLGIVIGAVALFITTRRD